MSELLGVAAGAAVVFAGTDIDDILVLTVLFVASRTSVRLRPWHIVAGQYAGIGVLAAVSAVAAAGLLVVPEPWTGLLGLLPIALGVRALLVTDEDDAPTVVGGVGAVTALTIANGADNLAVYVPVFRTLDLAQAGVFLLVFLVLIALWCAAAAWLGGHPRVIRMVERIGHRLVPLVLIGIGLVILISSGVARRLLDLS